MQFKLLVALSAFALAAPAPAPEPVVYATTITITQTAGQSVATAAAAAAAAVGAAVATTTTTSPAAVATGAAPAAGAGYYQIQVVNNCKETIWPGLGQVDSSSVKMSYEDSGFALAQGASRTLSIPTKWLAGRIFARTGCTGSGASMTCAVGQCSGGQGCTSTSGVPNVSLAEFSYSDMDLTFYNLSLDSGYNLPIQVKPTAGECATYTCKSKDCSDDQAYQPWSSKNPCMGCKLSSSYTVTFCPA